jgi:hypothetical protein
VRSTSSPPRRQRTSSSSGTRSTPPPTSFAAYLQADPCPLPELAGAFASLVLISGSVANAFATWHRMAPLERQAAVERTRELGAQAEAIAGVLAPYASSTPPGAEEFPPFASAPGRRVSNSLEGR